MFELAKELGIKSKEIILRCNDEGVPGIDNHMTTVGAGLAESIRQWFSNAQQSQAGTAVSAVAVAAPDEDADDDATSKTGKKKKVTAKVAKPAKKKVKAKPLGTAKKKAAKKKAVKKKVAPKPEPLAKPKPVVKPKTPSEVETGTTIERNIEITSSGSAEAPSSETSSDDASVLETKSESKPLYNMDEATLQPAADVSGDPAKNATAPTKLPATTGRKPRVVAVPNVPVRPDSVAPAGPKLEEQKPAKLSGPKVIRIEEADIIDKPRPRTRSDQGGPPRGRSGGGGFAGGGPGGPRGGGGGGAYGGAGAGGGGAGAAGGAGAGAGSRRNARRKQRSGAKPGRTGSAGRGGQGAGPTTGRLQNWGEQDLAERAQRLRGSHGFIKSVRRESSKRDGGGERAKSAKETGGVVKIHEPFTIKDLSAATGVKGAAILMALMQRGMMTTINSGIDTELAMEILLEHDIELEIEEQQSAVDLVADTFAKREHIDVQSRSPVVTILGHVDHGKTSLLDRIRQTNVADGEAGGITQHTSAFRVNVEAGDSQKTIVFLDTPGHEAFTAMRARGATVTDIVILVVAADDGVMPQTVESINHAKAAGVPIIIALNKIDKPEATESNLQRIFGQLAEHELSPTEWGGSTELVKCSAITGDGIQDLLDIVDLQSEVMELDADSAGPARGNVIEARMVEGRGPVANVLIREGEIKVGDFIVSGRAFGRVRDMTNDRNDRLKIAGPSTPLEVSGLNLLPDAGDSLYVVDSLKMAEKAAQQRLDVEREQALAAPKVTLDNIFSTLSESDKRELCLVVKADTQGSVETLRKTLTDISTDELSIRVLHGAVGGIVESDIILAEASDAIVLGFHVIASAKARSLADQKSIEIRTYQIIYELLDDVRKAGAGLLDPELREEVLGHAEVREVFKVSKVGAIAGCYVTDGSLQRNANIRITRQDIVIENNRILEQLKRFKDDAKEVRAGQECGMKIEGYDDIKSGDILECYKTTEIQREL